MAQNANCLHILTWKGTSFHSSAKTKEVKAKRSKSKKRQKNLNRRTNNLPQCWGGVGYLPEPSKYLQTHDCVSKKRSMSVFLEPLCVVGPYIVKMAQEDPTLHLTNSILACTHKYSLYTWWVRCLKTWLKSSKSKRRKKQKTAKNSKSWAKSKCNPK